MFLRDGSGGRISLKRGDRVLFEAMGSWTLVRAFESKGGDFSSLAWYRESDGDNFIIVPADFSRHYDLVEFLSAALGRGMWLIEEKNGKFLYKIN
jgi:hypothetical protein